MAILVGIDEAGYGPVLGPLIVSATAWCVPDDAAEQCLWERLRESVCRRPVRRDRRLPILDSKKLFHRKTGLAGLERSALTVLRLAGTEPASFRDLLGRVCPDTLGQLDLYPWYRDFDLDLPVSLEPGTLGTQANALRLDCVRQQVTFAGAFSEALPEGHFNRLVSNTRNKSVVLLGLVLRVLSRAMAAGGDQPVRVFVDRQGGRARYAAHLLTAFDGYDLQILEESPERSAYALRRKGGEVRVEFVVSGEDHHLPVALASIVSKYLRELFMIGLNRYWAGRVPGLSPTAGYYTDGHRFLKDIAPALREAGVDRSLLVRMR